MDRHYEIMELRQQIKDLKAKLREVEGEKIQIGNATYFVDRYGVYHLQLKTPTGRNSSIIKEREIASLVDRIDDYIQSLKEIKERIL